MVVIQSLVRECIHHQQKEAKLLRHLVTSNEDLAKLVLFLRRQNEKKDQELQAVKKELAETKTFIQNMSASWRAAVMTQQAFVGE